MDANELLSVVLAGLVVAVIVVAVVTISRRYHTAQLKKLFGAEYEHAVHVYGDPHEAEADLQARQKRVEAFDIHPLSPEERDIFAGQWRQIQAQFVDAPDRAVADADRLVKLVMQQRGYPVGDFEQQAADISVDHPNVVTHYRTAHEIALQQEKGIATTEDLRQALVHYRALFEDLLQPASEERVLQEKANA